MNFRFGQYDIDLAQQELRCAGEAVPVEPQVFDVLVYLVQHRDRIISKDELFETVWQGRVVSDAALNSRISAARRAVGDDGSAQKVIRTIHKRGFRFVAEVEPDAAPAVVPSSEEARADDAPTLAPAAEPAEPLPLPLPSKPSIAVLPFQNMSGDPEQDYFADGIVEEITTALSRNRAFFVVARNSSWIARSSRRM